MAFVIWMVYDYSKIYIGDTSIMDALGKDTIKLNTLVGEKWLSLSEERRVCASYSQKLIFCRFSAIQGNVI